MTPLPETAKTPETLRALASKRLESGFEACGPSNKIALQRAKAALAASEPPGTARQSLGKEGT